MNDYERVAAVIRFLDAEYRTQPRLGRLAHEAGLSPCHFHRLFSTWAGVTPKDFLQCLTLMHAKRLLQSGQNALSTALDAGLSGPGRLHDLCVTLEGASPGELKTGGATWSIAAGFAQTPFGTALVAHGPRGICHLSFVELGEKDSAWAELRHAWPNARLASDDAAAREIAGQIFARSTRGDRRPPFRAFVTGTEFQLRVWRALVQIPAGRVTSYGRLAAALGCPTAARAVGSAVGSNCLSFLIPCHRVIRETGVVGDYRWGPVRKHAMLAWEMAGNQSSQRAQE